VPHAAEFRATITRESDPAGVRRMLAEIFLPALHRSAA